MQQAQTFYPPSVHLLSVWEPRIGRFVYWRTGNKGPLVTLPSDYGHNPFVTLRQIRRDVPDGSEPFGQGDRPWGVLTDQDAWKRVLPPSQQEKDWFAGLIKTGIEVGVVYVLGQTAASVWSALTEGR